MKIKQSIENDFIQQAIEIILQNYRKTKMKKTKQIPEPSLIAPHQKFTQNILKTKPKKQFQLLYRERDQSIQENPIESIIFVKSKPCKPISHAKKIKVQEQFKKIMNDLDNHVNQHKKNKSSQKKSYSPASSQKKSNTLSKAQTKQSDFAPNKNKTIQKDSAKILKTVNKGNQAISKQKVQNLQTCKSPKNNHLSPNSKRMLSPKPTKLQKENIQTKRFTNEKLDRTKSPHKKSNHKGYVNQTECDETLKKTKSTEKTSNVNHNSNHSEEFKKTQIKRNIRRIPLKVEEYILLEDNFELVKQKSLYKLQTKLLSTYRNNVKQFENKLQFRGNLESNEMTFQKINRPEMNEDYMKLIQMSQQNSVQNRSQFNLESQNEIKDFSLTDPKFQQEIIKKITLIQKWWRRTIKIKWISNYIDLLLQNEQNRESQQNIQTEINYTTPANLPSAKSITINEEFDIESEKNQNEQMTMLKNQNQIVRQKKNMHEKILQNLFKQKKIIKDQFDAKMALVQKEYENQLKDIMSLYRLCEGQDQQNESLNQNNDKISQGRKISNHNDSAKTQINKNQEESTKCDDEEDQIQLKKYKIGDKITSDMQAYIENAKKNKESSTQIQQNNFDSEKYNIRTNELGEEYFQDFQSESSNEASPHKMFQPSNFDQFEADINAQNNGAFHPNTNFIQMLQQYKEQEQIKSRIDQRIALQMGAFKMQNPNELSIDTSILGIHQFLVNFFKFYLYYYKDEFLRFINMPYGYQPEKRLKFIQGYEDASQDLSEDEDGIIYGLQYIISDDIFEEFIDQYYGPSLKTADQKQKALIECSQMHDRALFECFNEALNNFRPYYSIGGPPYIWNCSEKTLTFYFIAEENIQEVFQKTEFKVMKWASALLGLQVQGYDTKKEDSKKEIQNNKTEKQKNVQQILQDSHSNCHPMINETRQERQIKEERLELIDSMPKWGDHQQQRTSTLYELSSLILEELTEELVRQFMMKC